MGQYLRPRSLNEALEALADGCRAILAGGTDHFPARVLEPRDERILDIGGLPNLRRIETRADGSVWIPCLATWTDLIEAGLPARFDGLSRAASQVGGAQIQNAGTLVGNICNASPAADGVPCLIALDAEVELLSVHGSRQLAVEDFVLGARRTARAQDELVTGVLVPPAWGEARSHFEKLGGRAYLVISVVTVAVVAQFDADARIRHARVAVGACNDRAKRLMELEAAMIGIHAGGLMPDLVEAAHLAPLAPIDDIRASADYRRAAALQLVRRAIAGLRKPEDELGNDANWPLRVGR